MKNHAYLIKLIIITAALIGLGVIAFKYLLNQNNDNVKIQTSTPSKSGGGPGIIIFNGPDGSHISSFVNLKNNNTKTQNVKIQALSQRSRSSYDADESMTNGEFGGNGR